MKDHIVEDEEGRKARAERYLYSQKFHQDDPWQKCAEGSDKHEFEPLKSIVADLKAG